MADTAGDLIAAIEDLPELPDISHRSRNPSDVRRAASVWRQAAKERSDLLDRVYDFLGTLPDDTENA